jgi:HlyD family secretion protein
MRPYPISFIINALLPPLIGAAILSNCTAPPKNSRVKSNPPPIPVATARQMTIKAKISISGIIAPFQNVAISSSLAEPTLSVAVNEGDRVTRGQTLAVLDVSDLRANLAQAQSLIQTDIRAAASADAKAAQARYQARLNIGQGGNQVSSARAALAQAQQTLVQAKSDLQRDRALVTQGYISQQALDLQITTVNNDASQVRTAQANLQSAIINEQVNGTTSAGLQAANVDSAVADARAAHSTIGQAQAQAQQYQAQISRSTILSPVDGVVANRNLNPGEYPGGRTLFTIQQLNEVYAELNASSADTFAIPAGAWASIAVASDPAHSYTGKVAAVLGQTTPGSTDFTVKVLLPNPDARLQSGLPVTGTITLPAISGVGVPTTSFLDDAHTALMIEDDQLDETVVKTVHVHELASNGTSSIVTGLKVGDVVVSNGQLGLTDGQSIDDTSKNAH